MDEAEKIFKQLAADHPTSKAIQSNLRLVAEHKRTPPTNFLSQASHNASLAEQLCRGEISGDYSSRKQGLNLNCMDVQYPRNHVQIDELHDSPKVYLIRNLLSSAQVDLIREEAKKKLLSNMLTDYWVYSASQVSVSETSTEWIEPLAMALRNLTYRNSNVRMNDIISAALITDHSIGGSTNMIKQTYMKHHVWESLSIGNYYIFLNDVNAGGGLVFPQLKLRVRPEKGAVIFWQFRGQHGPIREEFTEYVECPVVRGNQWTAQVTLNHEGVLREIIF